ncbi:YbaB/EbfC family nucleoid-associated protein [Microbacterium resistens]|uniref:YbaB/EbfC family nucleoid-associated protein n=1 Tax=Microbacterium resistens TaxID=156977 RepID=A0ABY3RN46_9MICO|nr:YbaB/EbfC family nucleoid-associated protein [Microbacterium resistens]UGS25303.1 YbaB/EbfC family nucleoid-associated protein [Microbacterium resistens]
MTDDIDRLYDLRDEIDLGRQRFAQGTPPEDEGEASDPSGAIRVVARRSENHIRVHLGDRWEDAHEPEALGAAIVATYAQIAYAALGAWGESVAEAPEPTRATPLPPLGSSVASRVEDAFAAGAERPDIHAVMHNVTEILQQLSAGFAEAAEAVGHRATAEYDGSTYGGHVTATVNGAGHLVRLVLSPQWLGRTRASGIATEINAAIDAAVEQIPPATAAGALEGTPLAEFAALAEDPDALVKRLLGR